MGHGRDTVDGATIGAVPQRRVLAAQAGGAAGFAALAQAPDGLMQVLDVEVGECAAGFEVPNQRPPKAVGHNC